MSSISSDLIVKFMTEQPFFYGVWTQLRTVWKSGKDFPFVGGVCHTASKGFTLVLNRDEWPKLDEASQVFLLAHECAHVALGHVPPDEQTKTLHRMRANVAMDLVINEHFAAYRQTELGKQSVWLDRFPKLPQHIKDMDWRGLYELLGEEEEDDPQRGQGEGGEGFDDHSFESDENPGEEGDGKGGLSNADLADLAKAQAEEIARNAARHCQMRGLESGIPHQIQVMIARPKKTHIQLVREILQKFVMSSRDTKKRLTWRRVSRRLGAIARGRLSARLPRVGIAIDSSGSMCTPETIDLIGQAISAVCAVADQVDCVVGDTEVRATVQLTPGNVATAFPQAMQGGGGTTLQPLLSHLAQQAHYDAVILVTDGYCEHLHAEQPTVALITPGGVDAPGLKSVHLQAKGA